MDFKELCNARYSVRAYKAQPVPEEKLSYIKECVRLAPSAVNKQPWKFIIIKDETLCKKLHSCYSREWFQEAPLYIVACKNESMAWTRRCDGKNHADIDLSIAVEHICLAATEIGLGTCWVCNFDVNSCKETLALDSEWEPVAIVPIGYPATDEIPEKNRKSNDEIWEER